MISTTRDILEIMGFWAASFLQETEKLLQDSHNIPEVCLRKGKKIALSKRLKHDFLNLRQVNLNGQAACLPDKLVCFDRVWWEPWWSCLAAKAPLALSSEPSLSVSQMSKSKINFSLPSLFHFWLRKPYHFNMSCFMNELRQSFREQGVTR